MHRLNELWSLQERYSRLDESLKKLQHFLSLKGKDELRLLFKTSEYRNDDSFETTNSVVTQEVVKFIIDLTRKKMKELEPQITW